MIIYNANESIHMISVINELTLEEIYFINTIFGIDFFVDVNNELLCERGIDISYQ